MESITNIFKSMSPMKLFGIAIGFVILLVGIISILFSFSTKNFDILYSSLDVKDSYEIINELEARGIDYEIRANGSQILVPRDDILRIRMELAGIGIPNKGSITGYEIFDKSDTIGTSSFLQNVNLIRALEGELSRTISTINQIESARVHLVIPKRELFSRDVQKPSASVMIKTRGNDTISKDQINAISHLVSSAVPGLDINQVTIIDAKGRSLKLSSDEADDSHAAIISHSEDFKINYEKRIKRTIEELLERSVGPGKVIAQVTADINFDRIITNSEIYDPDGQVVRSVQSIQENENSSEGGQRNVSVMNNMPNTQETNNVPGYSTNMSKLDETTNYEISKIVKNHISETGTVKKLSIAVIVDGTYNVNNATREVTYIPRTEEELEKFKNLIKSAVGFDESRKDQIEIANMQFTKDLTTFEPETLEDWLKQEFANLVQTFIIATVVILVILLVIRPIALRAFEIAKTDIEDTSEVNIEELLANEQDLAKSDIVEAQQDVVNIQEVDMTARGSAGKAINDLVGKYPRETLVIMRRWFHEGS